MSSKVIGLMLILGTILTMGVWIVFDIDTSGMSPSDSMTAILADKTKLKLLRYLMSLE